MYTVQMKITMNNLSHHSMPETCTFLKSWKCSGKSRRVICHGCSNFDAFPEQASEHSTYTTPSNFKSYDSELWLLYFLFLFSLRKSFMLTIQEWAQQEKIKDSKVCVNACCSVGSYFPEGTLRE